MLCVGSERWCRRILSIESKKSWITQAHFTSTQISGFLYTPKGSAEESVAAQMSIASELAVRCDDKTSQRVLVVREAFSFSSYKYNKIKSKFSWKSELHAHWFIAHQPTATAVYTFHRFVGTQTKRN